MLTVTTTQTRMWSALRWPGDLRADLRVDAHGLAEDSPGLRERVP